jgi:adenosine deaminase
MERALDLRMPDYHQVFNSHPVADSLKKRLQSMPKVELHIHLEGATSPEAIFRMARRNGISLPAADLESWNAFCRFTDFNHFITVYETSTKCMLAAADFTEMVVDFCERQARHNVRYTEAYLSTGLHLEKLPAGELITALEKGIREGEQKYGTRVRFIPDISRERPWQQDGILAFAVEAGKRGAGLGLGLGGIETGYPPRLFQETYDKARKAGLHVVAHAGETAGAECIRETVQLLHAERIGHGIRVLDDPEVIELLKKDRVPFEVSPQSNYCTGVVSLGQPHPVRTMKDRGLLCTINSDDPAMFSSDLSNEYFTLAAQGFSLEELISLDRNAVLVSFMSQSEKESALKMVDDFTRGAVP